jgi:hypothetical protein
MSLLNNVAFAAVAGGTGDFGIAAAKVGSLTPAQSGAVTGGVYSYNARSNDNSQWEIGRGTYSSTGPVFARTTVLMSSAANAKVNFSAPPTVMIDALAEDFAPPPSAPSRPLLQAALTIYVNADTGNDSNAGTSTAPFKTMAKAWNTLCSYDLNGFDITVQLQDATAHYGPVVMSGDQWSTVWVTPIGSGNIFILGNSADATKVVIDADAEGAASLGWGLCFYFGGIPILSPITIAEVTLVSPTVAWGGYVSVVSECKVNVGKYGGHVILGTLANHATGFQATAVGAQIVLNGNMTMTPGAAGQYAFASGSGFGEINCQAAITIVGNPTYNTAFILLSDGALFLLFSSFTGTINGPAYSVSTGSILDNAGGTLPSGSRIIAPSAIVASLMAGVTVANLPTASAGTRAFVTDATVTTFGTTVVGGGTNFVPVYRTASAWVIG